MRRLVRLVLVVACSSLGTVSIAGCGSGSDAGAGSGASGAGASGAVATTPDGCVIATAGSFRYEAGANSGWFTAAWGAAIEPSLGEGWQVLQIKLTERDGEAKPGTYDLSKEGLSTGACSRCVYVAYQGSGDHFQVDLATSGTLVIDEVDMDTGILRGSLSNVRFQHVVETSLHHFEGLAPDRHCVSLASASIDTRPIAGSACLSAGDCPNAKLQVCDPRTAQCADVACTANNPSCPGTDICQIQDVQQGTGACYQRCTPFASGSCPSGQDCVVNDYIGVEGICKRQGPESPEPATELMPGRSCEPRQIATGCGPGHVCATDAVYWHYDHCYEQCDYFADSPACNGGRCYLFLHSKGDLSETWMCGVGDCHFGGFCVEPEDDVDFGAPCEEGWYCRGDASRSGICLRSSSGDVACRRLCRLAGSDCADGETCRQVTVPEGDDDPRVIPGLGYCAP
jgi:hypothetical protein